MHRPEYHFSPREQWLNDPNGLVYYQGEYHLYYQYHPGSPVWGPMHWGHAVSPDLIHWQHLPVALFPDEYGMIFSGSAVIDWENTAGFGAEAMVAIFTHHQRGLESQSLAFSTDQGRTWSKYAHNPVLLPPPGQANFRDPKVFWYGDRGSGHWVMALAAGKCVRFYTSGDLIHWRPGGSFGSEHGAQTGVWETPDLFELPVEGRIEGRGDARWALTAGIGDGGPGGISGMQYFIGDFDGETFTSENPKDTVLWMDFGADYYASQSWNEEPKGRRVAIGWMNNWQYANAVPTLPFRGLLSLPRELSLRETESGVRLFQSPIAEVTALRRLKMQMQNLTIEPGTKPLETTRGDALEIYAEFQVNPKVERFGLRVRVGGQQRTTIGYDVGQQTLFLDRTYSGQSDFDAGFARVHSAPMATENGKICLHIFVDHSCIEVFGDGGRVVISDTVFPDGSSQGLELFAEGSEVDLNVFELYEMDPAVSNG